MGPDSANLAGSIAKSVEVQRSPHATQRASEIAQDQLASEFAGTLGAIKSDAAVELRRARIRQERDRRRRELERRGLSSNPDGSSGPDENGGLDVLV